MEKIMIAIEAVSRLRWDAELGAQLKARRISLKLSRLKMTQDIAEIIKLPEKGSVSKLSPGNFSTKYLEDLEKGDPNSVAVETLQAIATVLGVGVEDLLASENSIKIIVRETP